MYNVCPFCCEPMPYPLGAVGMWDGVGNGGGIYRETCPACGASLEAWGSYLEPDGTDAADGESINLRWQALGRYPEARPPETPPPEATPSDAMPTEIDGYPATKRYENVAEAEAEHGIELDGTLVPFGHINAKWKAMISQMRAGDELWLSSWGMDENGLSGAEVLFLVRAGKVIDGLSLKIGVQ